MVGSGGGPPCRCCCCAARRRCTGRCFVGEVLERLGVLSNASFDAAAAAPGGGVLLPSPRPPVEMRCREGVGDWARVSSFVESSFRALRR